MQPNRVQQPFTLVFFLLLGACAESPVRTLPPEGLPVASSASVAGRAGAEGVPITGYLEGTTTYIRTWDTERTYRLEHTATGKILHLGRASYSGVVPAVRIDLVGRRIVVLSAGSEGTMTAASGEQLFGTYTFREHAIPLDWHGNFRAVTDISLTGGTGRFAGAKGRGTSTIEGNILSPKYRITVEGVLQPAGTW